MTPLGGLCFGPLPRSAREELVITFFGPLVNLLFVVLFLGVLFLWQLGSGRPLGLVDLRGEYSSWSTTGMELLSLAYALHPAFGEAQVVDQGAGVRPSWPDNYPKIVPRGKVVVSTGSTACEASSVSGSTPITTATESAWPCASALR